MRVTGSPDDVTTGRLVGGPLDGIELEIEPGREVVELGAPFLALFGSPPEELERVRRTTWEYRYARVEPDSQGSVAVFEFIRAIEHDPPV